MTVKIEVDIGKLHLKYERGKPRAVAAPASTPYPYPYFPSHWLEPRANPLNAAIKDYRDGRITQAEFEARSDRIWKQAREAMEASCTTPKQTKPS